ncbi:hypothetical protein [Geoalkalibacter sp.]|uniref:hypothetical protein n=1 Tax=Geoalkalibacter sp. TaxID=3041440 RepID=UPI00272EB85E|nr:hypothetical protein [Geoalkalibacter sp.]
MILASALYFDRTFQRPAVKIQQGQLLVTAEDLLITTVLGSCVSVCVRDRVRGLGGMNHFMLPGEKTGDHSPRYGEPAMDQLLDRYLEAGGRVEHLEVKVFGAGRINRSLPDVGKKNVEFALAYLKRHKLALAALDVGDTFPRKVCFSPRCGRVFVKTLRNIHQEGFGP